MVKPLKPTGVELFAHWAKLAGTRGFEPRPFWAWTPEPQVQLAKNPETGEGYTELTRVSVGWCHLSMRGSLRHLTPPSRILYH
jgi:hypothetical protein